jgi:hypothetical protein
MADIDPFEGLDLDDEDDTPDEGTTPPAGQDNASFQALRKALRAAKKVGKEKDAQLAELTTFKAEVEAEKRTQALQSVFKEAELDPDYAKLFEKVSPEAEVTIDTVKAFANEYKLPTVSGDAVDAPPAETPGFTPVVTNQGGGLKKYTRAEIETLAYTNPELANKAIAEGRVDMSKKG